MKKAVSVREVDPEVIPISIPRYFLTLHIDPGAPAAQVSLFTKVVWAAGAPGSSHRVVLTQVTFRGQIDGERETPTVTQMLPQTRYYVNLSLAFVKF